MHREKIANVATFGRMDIQDWPPQDLLLLGVRIDIVEDVDISTSKCSWWVETVVANAVTLSVPLIHNDIWFGGGLPCLC
jgi:hypothetical protein